jgi:uncharacterized membrane protein YtjA (UPF0391 family)
LLRDTALIYKHKGNVMLRYAVIFFVIALVTALFGFTGIAVGVASIAKILFMIFIVVALMALVMGLMRPRA